VKPDYFESKSKSKTKTKNPPLFMSQQKESTTRAAQPAKKQEVKKKPATVPQ